MYFFQYYSQVAVLFYVMGMINHAISNKSQKEQAFSDVFKNITLANKILQELLKNYERLEKVYQSEESLTSDSSSQEIDQTFKSFMSNQQNFKHRDNLPKAQTSSPFIGTAMIYDNDSFETKSEETTKKSISIDMKPEKTHLKYVNDNKVVHNSDVDNKILNNKLKNENTDSTLGKNKAELEESSSEDTQSEEIEKIIINVSRDVSSDSVKDENDVAVTTSAAYKKNIKTNPNNEVNNRIGEKKRFVIKHSPSNNIGRTNVSKRVSRTKNNGRKIKKVVYPEKITPDKIGQANQPVIIRKAREIFFRKSNKSKTKNKEKITVLILTNNEKINKYWRERSKKQKSNSEGLLNFNKTGRRDYGETCLGVPIKKCKKALKNVKKNICNRRFKCKSDFKSDFIINSKNGCNKEFAYREETANKTNYTNGNIEKFSPPDFSELKIKHSWNKLDQQSIENLSNKLQDNFISLRNETPDMLRRRKDKYERKCQKESTKKCNNACSYAIKETCDVHTCQKKKKKAMKSECKSQCKRAYKNVKITISSSKSDSDSDSDSNDSD